MEKGKRILTPRRKGAKRMRWRQSRHPICYGTVRSAASIERGCVA
jgi:hypothetical protein